jgi:hypothetical protein
MESENFEAKIRRLSVERERIAREEQETRMEAAQQLRLIPLSQVVKI